MKFQELRNAGDDAWEVIREGAENIWSDVKIAFQGAATKFK
jgi:hypothetical protein